MSDLEQYLTSEQGICIDKNIVGHLLWAHDLILFSDSVAGLQKQLNGVMKVYYHLNRLHEQGFTNWITKALDLAKTYDIDIKCTKPCFRDVCKYEIKEHFINEWRMSIQNTTLNPILRTYNVLKTRFGTEPYLRSVKDIKYRVAIPKLRVSSHALEIERAWSMTPVNERLCRACQKVEDEFHFMMECKSNSDLRQTFINKPTTRCPNFADLSQREQFVYMFTNEYNMSLTWLGKFIYKSFQRRNSFGSNL